LPDLLWKGRNRALALGHKRNPEQARIVACLRQLVSLILSHIYSITEPGSLPRVGSDDQAIGRLAAEHLLECQLRCFAYCGYEGLIWSEQRCSAFAATVAQAGFPCHRHLEVPRECVPSTWEHSQQALADWIRRLPKPVGLLAANDDYAQRVLDACRPAAAAVPEDVAVIGVENDEDLGRLCDPPLSSVAVNARQIGYEGARLLAQLMAGEVPPGDVAPRLIPPSGVVVRQSTDITAIESREVAEAVSFIRRRVCDRIQTSDVAAAICRSRATLYRLFEATLGRSPKQEILRVQLERARTLLAQTADTLDAIARLTGFNDASYFGVVFKRTFGMTAGEYRARHRNDA
jgi:LacI family transcriptional regulator